MVRKEISVWVSLFLFYNIPAGRTDTGNKSSDIAIIYATVQAIPFSYD